MSRGITSKATTAYSDARQRLPLDWVRQCFGQLAAALLLLGHGPSSPELSVELLDGSTKRLRPHGDMGQHFLFGADILARMETRARFFGERIGARYGEPLASLGPLPVGEVARLF